MAGVVVCGSTKLEEHHGTVTTGRFDADRVGGGDDDLEIGAEVSLDQVEHVIFGFDDDRDGDGAVSIATGQGPVAAGGQRGVHVGADRGEGVDQPGRDRGGSGGRYGHDSSLRAEVGRDAGGTRRGIHRHRGSTEQKRSAPSGVAGRRGTLGLVLRIAHLSDTHLGYEAYRAVDAAGRNVRGLDVVAAFDRAVDAICTLDPDLVVHAGDLFDRPQVPVRYLLAARAGFARLARRPDGRVRPVIVISGNHDQPRDNREHSPVELLASIDGVRVAAGRWERFELPELGVAVVAVPHDRLRELAREQSWETVGPHSPTDILLTHGVAGGTALFTRAEGREYPVPTEVLARPWAYVALGHWHLRTPVGDTGRVWYCGSGENFGFGDARAGATQRGFLEVTLDNGNVTVAGHDVAVRALVELPVIDADGLEPARVGELLTAALTRDNLTGAVVRQVVRNVTRETWGLVDHDAVRTAAAACLHHACVPVPPEHQSVTAMRLEAGAPLETLLVECAAALDATRRDPVLASARALLAEAEKELSS